MIAPLEPNRLRRFFHAAEVKEASEWGGLIGLISGFLMLFTTVIVWAPDDAGHHASWAPYVMWGWLVPGLAVVSGGVFKLGERDWGIRVVSWNGGDELEACRRIWDALPETERRETLPLMRAAYAAAERGGEIPEIQARLDLLKELAAEVAKEVEARKREAPDLGQVRTLIEGKRIANESMAEVRELGGGEG